MLGRYARPVLLLVLGAVGLVSLAESASAGHKPRPDVTPPTVVIEQARGQADPALSAPIRFTATFSETVTGFTGSDVAFGGTSGGTKTVTVSSRDQKIFTVSVKGMSGGGTVVATIPGNAARDAAGNLSLPSTSVDNSVTFGDLGPTVTVNQAITQPDPTGDPTVHFTAQFSEPVTNFASNDVTLSGTAGASTVSVTDSGDRQRFDIEVGGLSSDGTVSAAVPEGLVTDGAGDVNAPSTSTDGTITFNGPLASTPPTPPPAPDRVDLTARFGGDLAKALAWLAANPQPAIVTAGVYTTSGVLDIPAGADLVFADATIIPTNPLFSSVRIRGAGTKLTFAGTCRIGAVGATNGRVGNAEAAGIELEGASHFTITADALTIEGVAQDAIFSYRGSHDGVVAGKITAIDTGADSFHVTDGSYNLDFRAALVSVGSGDDGFAVVSYVSNVVPVRNVHWHDITVRNQRWGRGISVVGGQNVTVDHGVVDGSAGAGVYIAAEWSYNTFGVDGVTMNVRVRNPNTQRIHDANVVIYSAQPGQTIANVSVTADADTLWPLVQRTGAYPVSNVFVNGVSVS